MFGEGSEAVALVGDFGMGRTPNGLKRGPSSFGFSGGLDAFCELLFNVLESDGESSMLLNIFDVCDPGLGEVAEPFKFGVFISLRSGLNCSVFWVSSSVAFLLDLEGDGVGGGGARFLLGDAFKLFDPGRRPFDGDRIGCPLVSETPLVRDTDSEAPN